MGPLSSMPRRLKGSHYGPCSHTDPAGDAGPSPASRPQEGSGPGRAGAEGPSVEGLESRTHITGGLEPETRGPRVTGLEASPQHMGSSLPDGVRHLLGPEQGASCPLPAHEIVHTSPSHVPTGRRRKACRPRPGRVTLFPSAAAVAPRGWPSVHATSKLRLVSSVQCRGLSVPRPSSVRLPHRRADRRRLRQASTSLHTPDAGVLSGVACPPVECLRCLETSLAVTTRKGGGSSRWRPPCSAQDGPYYRPGRPVR